MPVGAPIPNLTGGSSGAQSGSFGAIEYNLNSSNGFLWVSFAAVAIIGIIAWARKK